MLRLPFIVLRSKHFRRFCFFFSLSLGAILLVNLFIGLLLHSNPILPFADSENQLFMMLTGTLLGAALFLLNTVLSRIEALLKKKENTAFLLVLCFPLLLLSSCEIETSSRVQVKSAVQGTTSNKATGLKAVYRNMETEKAKLVMNDEVLGHADIPWVKNSISSMKA